MFELAAPHNEYDEGDCSHIYDVIFEAEESCVSIIICHSAAEMSACQFHSFVPYISRGHKNGRAASGAPPYFVSHFARNGFSIYRRYQLMAASR